MDLSLLEMAVLKEAPFPSLTSSQDEIAKRALGRLGIDWKDRGAMTALRQLEARKFLERISIGGFRRTHEGNQALARNIRNLQNLAVNFSI